MVLSGEVEQESKTGSNDRDKLYEGLYVFVVVFQRDNYETGIKPVLAC